MHSRGFPSWTWSLLLQGALACAAAAWAVQLVGDNPRFAPFLPVQERWKDLHAQAPRLLAGGLGLFGLLIAGSILSLLVGRIRGRRFSVGWTILGVASAASLAVLGVHTLAYLNASKSPALHEAALATTPWVFTLVVGTVLAGFATAVSSPKPRLGGAAISVTAVCASAALFAAVFGGLAILQFGNLLVPHGDAAMYEEHLWNLLHGKGFRSQLDDGRLFLGEHIEFIHLLLIPVYLLHPSLTTLNGCQAAALASGAIAVFLIGRRLGAGPGSSATIAAAYLLYFPLQYLALEETWKTFRPENLAVPFVLFALLALECRRYRTMLVLLLLAATAKEEYALVTAAIGLVLLARREWAWGAWLVAGSLAYLALALGVLIPYFRMGGPPHYTPYFRSLGGSPGAILHTVATQPSLVWRRIATFDNAAFLLMMLGPFCFAPLLSPLRLLAAAPIFGYLMLGDLPELKQPWFHFHGPLAALVPWALAGGIANVSVRHRFAGAILARMVFATALVSCVWYGKGPLSWRFYDTLGSIPLRTAGRVQTFEPTGTFVLHLYPPPGRAVETFRDGLGGSVRIALELRLARQAAFERVLDIVKPTDRIAATDYIRARFTHGRAAYDYPNLRNHVHIGDVDVLVLDRTEGWWGRTPWRPAVLAVGLPEGAEALLAASLRDAVPDRFNPDADLLDAMNREAPVGTQVAIRGAAFTVVHHDRYFMVLRRRAEQ